MNHLYHKDDGFPEKKSIKMFQIALSQYCKELEENLTITSRKVKIKHKVTKPLSQLYKQKCAIGSFNDSHVDFSIIFFTYIWNTRLYLNIKNNAES